MAPRKTLWTDEEDDKLRLMVQRYGSKNWTRIASLLPTKVGKQCRRRWQNHLNATLKTYVWTAEEDKTLLEGHRILGNKWTEIARMVTGRTDNAVKNRFVALTKKGGVNSDGEAVDADGKPESADESGSTSQNETRGDGSSAESSLTSLKLSVREISPPVTETSSPRLPRTPRVPVTPNARPGSKTMISKAAAERREGFKVVRPAVRSRLALPEDMEATANILEGVLSNANVRDRAEGVSTSREEGFKSPRKAKRSDVREVIQAPTDVPMEDATPAPAKPSPQQSSPCLPTFQEASLLQNFADAGRPPTLDEIRHEFEELLVTASCIDGGSAFVATVLNTAKLTLASYRGTAPLMETYMSNLSTIFHIAHMGAGQSGSGTAPAKLDMSGGAPAPVAPTPTKMSVG